MKDAETGRCQVQDPQPQHNAKNGTLKSRVCTLKASFEASYSRYIPTNYQLAAGRCGSQRYHKSPRWQAAIAATAAAEEAGSSAQHVAEVSARAAGVAAGLDWPFWATGSVLWHSFDVSDVHSQL